MQAIEKDIIVNFVMIYAHFTEVLGTHSLQQLHNHCMAVIIALKIWTVLRVNDLLTCPSWKKHRHARRARVIFFCEVKASGDRSIQGSVYSNNLVNLTSFFGYDVQEERNREIMMYIRSYRTASNLNSGISSKTYPKNYKQ